MMSVHWLLLTVPFLGRLGAVLGGDSNTYYQAVEYFENKSFQGPSLLDGNLIGPIPLKTSAARSCASICGKYTHAGSSANKGSTCSAFSVCPDRQTGRGAKECELLLGKVLNLSMVSILGQRTGCRIFNVTSISTTGAASPNTESSLQTSSMSSQVTPSPVTTDSTTSLPNTTSAANAASTTEANSTITPGLGTSTTEVSVTSTGTTETRATPTTSSSEQTSGGTSRTKATGPPEATTPAAASNRAAGQQTPITETTAPTTSTTLPRTTAISVTNPATTTVASPATLISNVTTLSTTTQPLTTTAASGQNAASYGGELFIPSTPPIPSTYAGSIKACTLTSGRLIDVYNESTRNAICDSLRSNPIINSLPSPTKFWIHSAYESNAIPDCGTENQKWQLVYGAASCSLLQLQDPLISNAYPLCWHKIPGILDFRLTSSDSTANFRLNLKFAMTYTSADSYCKSQTLNGSTPTTRMFNYDNTPWMTSLKEFFSSDKMTFPCGMHFWTKSPDTATVPCVYSGPYLMLDENMNSGNLNTGSSSSPCTDEKFAFCTDYP